MPLFVFASSSLVGRPDEDSIDGSIEFTQKTFNGANKTHTEGTSFPILKQKHQKDTVDLANGWKMDCTHQSSDSKKPARGENISFEINDNKSEPLCNGTFTLSECGSYMNDDSSFVKVRCGEARLGQNRKSTEIQFGALLDK